MDAVEPQIRELLQAFPTMPATVIAERIGWTRSVRVLSGRVAELRPLYLPPDPSSRTSYAAGEMAQCDFWFPPIRLPVGFGQTRTAKQLPVLTMVCGYSRWLSAVLLPSRHAEDLFTGWWQLIEQLGAVPRVLVWDGEAAVGRWRGGRSELTAQCQAFRGTLGAKVLICRPADPEAKGIIERAHDYLERSFLPGRTFVSPADFNIQLTEWLATIANLRIRLVLGCAAADRITADRAAMLTLPPVAPTVGWRATTRLARDHYIRLDSNDYSVHPQVIGRRIEIAADLDGSGCSATADRSRTISGYGRGIRACTIPTTWPRPERCALRGWACCGRFASPRSSSAAWPTTTPPSASTPRAWTGPKVGWPYEHHHTNQGRGRPGCHQRGGIPDPGVEGAHAARVGRPAGRTGPRRVLDP